MMELTEQEKAFILLYREASPKGKLLARQKLREAALRSAREQNRERDQQEK